MPRVVVHRGKEQATDKPKLEGWNLPRNGWGDIHLGIFVQLLMGCNSLLRTLALDWKPTLT